ncbi:hypothetical protein GLI01_13540 [Gluconacetobacter liquefaciens]|nr:coenzyme PQQ precursor peptide PqqA [Gluconacetobacter liquefaciens]GBR02903.1 hypothetical protein AA0522_1684 [Gluconacetobacter liquefaciens NRIC 0522]GEB37319.1 hypothetical protein GLI01_13540 [Gluconacetobacter liquefaciens]
MVAKGDDQGLKPAIIGVHIQHESGSPAFMTRMMEDHMAWTAPKITEVPLGAEINSYVCGQKK